MLPALVGCAAPPVVTALRSAPPPDLPPRAELRHLPFFAQADTLCGPAVLASLLAAAGRPQTLQSLVAEVYPPGRAGKPQAEMPAGARRHGLLAVELEPALAAALREVAAGWPVAVLLNLALPIWPRWHYAVLVGYDLPAGRVWLHSGTQARSPWSLETFEYTWARSGHWAFVALAPGMLPASADEEALTRALLAGDGVAAPTDAADAWSAAAQRWPGRLLLWLGAGNAWLAAGRPRDATVAFEQATRRFDSAVAWNNLAQSRLQLGNREGAESAARKAVARAEASEPDWLDTARRTLQETRR